MIMLISVATASRFQFTVDEPRNRFAPNDFELHTNMTSSSSRFEDRCGRYPCSASTPYPAPSTRTTARPTTRPTTAYAPHPPTPCPFHSYPTNPPATHPTYPPHPTYSSFPTYSPTPYPTKTPTPHPTKTPTSHPTYSPTPYPTKTPTPHPTKTPTPPHTCYPTPPPSTHPTLPSVTYSNHCDFCDHDIYTLTCISTPFHCASICAQDSHCTHFTHIANNNGGTCKIKSATGSGGGWATTIPSPSPYICGYIPKRAFSNILLGICFGFDIRLDNSLTK